MESRPQKTTPWISCVQRIHYTGNAFNIYPDKISFSCALGHVRDMKGIILTVQYKTYADIALIPEFPYEERFLVTIADVCKNREGESVFTKTYLWKIIEINGVPTAKDAVEGLPTFKSIENQEIWDAFKLFLIADDGMLRSYSELMKLST